MWRYTIALLVLASAILAVLADQSQVSIQIEHSFNGKDYFPKGVISFKNPNSFLNVDERKIQNSVKFSPSQVSSADLAQLSSAEGLYYIRATTDKGIVFSSAKLCTLAASDLAETIGVNLDTDGAVIGLEYRPETHSCVSNKKISAKQFKTEVDVSFPRAAAKVMSEYMPARVQEEAKPAADQGSWLSRYWYYIVPFVAISLIGQFLSPPAEGGNGGQGAGRRRA
eukprot:TRINITY_DN4252_c0_g1_i1.p1 TRINITY_DN4252_c0_g1~~TRINITY_DN4252_c0_g1_i1.p1  ORF type:complete len:225 (+),score=18.65 TRINITY_DN4252_c0_g1_i1:37-711(+)